MARHANIWVIEFIIAVVFFMIMVGVFISFGEGVMNKANPATNVLVKDAKAITDSLLSPGTPDDWAWRLNDSTAEMWVITDNASMRSTISSIGIVDSDGTNISVAKLFRFGAWTNKSSGLYMETKGKFGIGADFIIYFEDKNGNLIDFWLSNLRSGKFFGDLRLGSDPESPIYYNEESTVHPLRTVEELDHILTEENEVENLVKVYRYLFYRESQNKKGKIVRMAVYVW